MTKILFTAKAKDIPRNISAIEWARTKARLICREWPYDHEMSCRINPMYDYEFFWVPIRHFDKDGNDEDTNPI